MDKEIISLLDNRDFSDELVKLNNKNDIKKLFMKYGINISDQDLDSVVNFRKAIEKELSKLDDSQLEELGVSGGGFDPLTLVGSLSSIFKVVSECVHDCNNTRLENTRMICNSKNQIAKMKNDGALSRSKWAAADHMVGYTLVAAIAAAYFWQKKNKKKPLSSEQ